MINAERPRWQAKAECATDKSVSLDDFYAINLDLAKLRRVCGRCQVREDCLAYADEMSPSQGFFGGLTVDERKRRRSGKAIL